MNTFTPKFTLNLDHTFGPKPVAGGFGLHATQNYYHVVLCGNRRRVLFSTAEDRRALNAIATDVLQRFDATLHAYCLMPNHFRALVHINDRLLIKALRRIGTRYSQHRQRHQKTALHLFERPYTAQRVDTDGDFLSLLRHIHLTPVLANKVIAPDDYLWSSHRAYLGYKSVANITTDFGLSLLADNPAQARVAYHQFITEGLAANVRRAADRKTQTGDNYQANKTAAMAIADALLSPAKAPLIEPSTPPPEKSKPALLRLGRDRKRSRSRRFMSVY
jgi:REP element-mobilizing transposase RayT